MARVIWSGALAFGLVNVPVGLYSATEDRSVHFHQFEAGTCDRIRYRRVNERTGREVGYSDIVKGRMVDEDTCILLSDEELEAVEPGRSRTIEITDFVDIAEIDPMYYQRTYYLAPRGDGAGRPYALLREAMAETGKAGIATFVMRSKEYLVTVRPHRDILALETMFFADEVREPLEATGYRPEKEAPRSRELTIAKQLIDSMTARWDPSEYHDSYRERVEDLIERKRNGESITAAPSPPRESKVVDLTETLRRSVEGTRGRSRAGRGAAPDGEGGTGQGRGGRSRRDRSAGEPPPAEAGGEEDLSGMSKAELSRLAAKLGVSGRSKMTRDQLEAAVGDAQRGDGARAAS